MQLKFQKLITLFLLLNNFTLFAGQTSVLCDEITMGDTLYFRQGSFLAPSSITIELTKEDKALVEKIIKLYQVSRNTLVNFDCSDQNGASVGSVTLLDDPEAFPCISLSQSWRKLPYKQKEFVLAHEMAHFVLGHFEINHEEYIANLAKLDKPLTQTLAGIGFSGTVLSVLFMLDVRKNITKRCFACMSTIATVSACIYGISSTSLRYNQLREKEADIKAVTMLGDAQGGIDYFTADMNTETHYEQRFYVDLIGLSTHPSHYARICHLQEWQASQNKK